MTYKALAFSVARKRLKKKHYDEYMAYMREEKGDYQGTTSSVRSHSKAFTKLRQKYHKEWREIYEQAVTEGYRRG